MATTTSKTVTIEDLPEVLKRLNQEPIPPEVLERRRLLSVAEQKIVDAMEPLTDDVKDSEIARRQGCPFVHADGSLRRALAGRFPLEVWIEEYRSP